MITEGFLMFWGGITGTILVIIAAIIFLLRSRNVKRQVQNAFENDQLIPEITLAKAERPLDETVLINSPVRPDDTVLIGHEKAIDETAIIDKRQAIDETVLIAQDNKIDNTVLITRDDSNPDQT